jgi:copper transport protein
VRRWASAVLLVCALLGLGVLLDVATARPASAHAVVTSTTPADGARLDAAPTAVRVEFNESVSVGAGYARVLDADGDRVDTGDPAVRDGVLTVPLRADLPDASYVVTYRVVSADSHPVSGAFSFVVGEGALVPAGSVPGDDAVDPGVGVALPLARWLGYLGIALGVGLPAALAGCWPAGWSVPLLRRLAVAGLGAVAVSGVLLLLLQGAYAAGAGLGSAVDPQLIGTTIDSGYGRTLLARIVLAGLLAVVLLRGRPGRALLAVGGLLGGALVLVTAAVGHPVAGSMRALAVAVSTVHVAAMGVWVGGLVALLAGALRPAAAAAGPIDLGPALLRWSRVAAACIGALVVTGVLQSVREVGTLGGLVDTRYGWVLLAKLAVVAVVLVAALVSRDWVQQRLGTHHRPSRRVVAQAFAEPDPAVEGRVGPEVAGGADPGTPAVRSRAQPGIGVLRRSVLVEVVGAVVVLAVSAVLVSQLPATASVAAPVEVTLPLQSASGTSGTGTVQVSLDPAAPGPTTLHVHLFDAEGRLVQPRQITVALTEVQQEIGPLDVDLSPAGPGQYVGDAVLPAAGSWTLTVTVRLDEFTAVTASTAFPVR